MTQEEIDYFVTHFYHETFKIAINGRLYISGVISNPNKGEKVALNWVNCNIQLRRQLVPGKWEFKNYWIPLVYLLKATCYIYREYSWMELDKYLNEEHEENKENRFLIPIY